MFGRFLLFNRFLAFILLGAINSLCSCSVLDIMQIEPSISVSPILSFQSEADSINAYCAGKDFSSQIQETITDFIKEGDLMAHVSSFCIIDDIVYMTYYANRVSAGEEPKEHIARFVICPLNNPHSKTYYDLQGAVSSGLPEYATRYDGKKVTELYDTILLRKDDDNIFIMWTAALDGVYTRLYQVYNIPTKSLSPINYNYFSLGSAKKIMSTTEIEAVLNLNNVIHKPLSIDIGIMQKLTIRKENGITYYYTGCYANKFNCIIKSKDLITWEYVSTPSFNNESQFENATYVIGNIAYYFCRQEPTTGYGFLTSYDIIADKWAAPILVNDAQSRSDFIEYQGSLYLIHAPIDRYHLGVIKVDTNNINLSKEMLVADVPNYFYPFSQVYKNDLYISFTQSRQHIYLSKVSLP